MRQDEGGWLTVAWWWLLGSPASLPCILKPSSPEQVKGVACGPNLSLSGLRSLPPFARFTVTAADVGGWLCDRSVWL